MGDATALVKARRSSRNLDIQQNSGVPCPSPSTENRRESSFILLGVACSRDNVAVNGASLENLSHADIQPICVPLIDVRAT